MPVIDPTLARRARRRHGVLTTTDALELGRSSEQLRRAVDRGELERVHPTIFRIAGAPRTWQQSVLLAVLAAGRDALASHRAAAVLWNLAGSTRGRPELVTPRHLRSRYVGVKVHESTDLDLAEPTERDGIPCTGLLRTLVDLGAVVPRERLQQAADDAVDRRLTTWDEIIHARARHARRGRRGVGPLRQVILVSAGRSAPGSHFNRLVERLLVDSGLPQPEIEWEVHDAGRFVARIDLAYPELLLGIELDGRAYHDRSAAFEHDPQRQNRLELLGWTVLRYTWRSYMDRPWQLVAEVRDAHRRLSELRSNLRQQSAWRADR